MNMSNCQEIVEFLKDFFKAKDEDYTYNITSSNYNPNIDNNVTITVTVTDGNDDPVTSHSFTLNANGTNVSLTTNSSGVATYTYSCSTWGECRFSVQTYTTSLNVKGWKQVANETNYQIYENKEFYYIVINVSSITFSSQSWATHFNIASPYRPPSHIPLSTSSRSAMGRFATTGDVQVINLGTSSVTTGISGTCMIRK